MKHLNKATALALLMSLSGTVYTTAAVAAPDYAKIEERKKAKTKIMGERTGKKVVKAFDLYNEDKIDEAIAELKELDPSNDFDKATVNRYLGNMYAQKERYDDAIKYIRSAIAPDALNFKDQADLYKLLGDLLIGTNKYQEAIKTYNDWMDFTGEEDPKVYARIAQAYYELKQYSKVIEPADKAIKLDAEPNKQYHMLKIGSFFELKKYKDAVKVAEILVKLFPEEPKMWTQLGSFYMQTEDYSEGLTVMEIAYRKGYFEKENHYKILSSYYSLNDIPYKAAVVFEKALKDGKVERTKQNVTATASYYHQAKHLVDAAKYYEEAAKFDNDAELYRKAGSLLLTGQKFSAAVERLNKALELGTDKEGNTYTDLAEAYLYQEKYKQAYQAIVKAQEDPRTRKFARGWATFIKDKAQRKGVKI
ncbi:tetratricopeptide repeat protein [Pseudoalteromonas sp. JBTF-M23]|uniref:Tetratricopeptide repeat protein n=1 Tax=Pseudoalteromonas caenipelagi TaxID=2726988 RepID=A0A849VCE8_9GAMM|nr:tetratricopeptide repeat protein [Pseudoalteromonas caenipelagi]NOU49624.1 tetratricopeptide repeat protein [Pseudoalteromonas caenipelagi]